MAYIRKVQYYETDKMGIVHHSNYIRWFEEARTYYMKENGIDYNLVEKECGLMMPVIGVSCSYKQGAEYDDEVKIETVISDFNGVKLTFSYKVLKEDILLVSGTSTHCFVDMAFKPVSVKKNNKDLYNKILELVE
ncbi:MAG: acyl-CoA thioesterase [Lachnospirales bacterium]